MRTIWLDVSTVLGWRRPAVGIVRVEAECAAYSLSRAEQVAGAVRFCRFDAVSGYHEVPANEVADALARIKGLANGGTTDPTAAPAAPVATLQQRLNARARRLIKHLPARWQPQVLGWTTRRAPALGSALQGLREWRHALKIVLRPGTAGPAAVIAQAVAVPWARRAAVPFAPGDVYVSMGLDWDQKDLVYLYAQKRAVGFKVLLFCYDVIPVKLPHLCVGDVAASFARYFANVAWCADEVLCISECSRRDLRALLTELGTPQPPLSVIRLGCQLPLMAGDLVESAVSGVLGQRYVLFVSTIERRKNHETLYRAYARLVDQGETDLPLLVFVGMPGWGVNDLLADLRFDPRTQGLIKVLNHVTDADLARLYQQALFTVFPSLYEGWGLPVAESLAAGKFCLASNAASIPEVGGDLVEYLDPWDVPLWAERLLWYFRHADELAQKEARIRQDFQPMRWQQCAQDILLHATSRIAAVANA